MTLLFFKLLVKNDVFSVQHTKEKKCKRSFAEKSCKHRLIVQRNKDAEGSNIHVIPPMPPLSTR